MRQSEDYQDLTVSLASTRHLRRSTSQTTSTSQKTNNNKAKSYFKTVINEKEVLH